HHLRQCTGRCRLYCRRCRNQIVVVRVMVRETTTRFHLDVDSWFPKETKWIQRLMGYWIASIPTFGGCHSIQLSYERDPCILLHIPHRHKTIGTVAAGRGMFEVRNNTDKKTLTYSDEGQSFGYDVRLTPPWPQQ